MLKGWTDLALLESYSEERAPVGAQVVQRANQFRLDYAPLKAALRVEGATLAVLPPEIGAIAGELGLAGGFSVAIVVALALDLAVNIVFNPTRALIADATCEGAERTRAYIMMQVASGSLASAPMQWVRSSATMC